jgi:hypothetical protein
MATDTRSRGLVPPARERTLRALGGVILRTASKAMGGPQRLADTLGVPQPDLEAWIAGNKPPLGALVFLALVLVGQS